LGYVYLQICKQNDALTIFAVRLYPRQCRRSLTTTSRRASSPVQRPSSTNLNYNSLRYDGYHGKIGSDLVACRRMAGRVYILDQCEVFFPLRCR
jgi:hypothetical protein